LSKKLLASISEGKSDDPNTLDVANVLYDTAVLNSGYALNEPADLTARIVRMAALSLNLDPNEQPEEEVIVEEPDDEPKVDEKANADEPASEEPQEIPQVHEEEEEREEL